MTPDASAPTTTPVFDDAPLMRPGELFTVADILSSRSEPWFNQSLVTANDSVLRVARLHGEFHHHSHETDELFFVLDGEMELELDGTTHTLSQGKGLCVPAGVVHRTRASEPATILLVAARDASMTGT